MCGMRAMLQTPCMTMPPCNACQDQTWTRSGSLAKQSDSNRLMRHGQRQEREGRHAWSSSASVPGACSALLARGHSRLMASARGVRGGGLCAYLYMDAGFRGLESRIKATLLRLVWPDCCIKCIMLRPTALPAVVGRAESSSTCRRPVTTSQAATCSPDDVFSTCRNFFALHTEAGFLQSLYDREHDRCLQTADAPAPQCCPVTVHGASMHAG